MYSDVCGLMYMLLIGGVKYFVIFIDNYIRCCVVYFMRYKLEVLEKFIEFEVLVINGVGKVIGILWMDNGSKYLFIEL